jgi:hypothetical protein
VKRIMAFAAAALAASAVFAADLSWGIGGSGGLFLRDQSLSLADPAVSVDTRETGVPFAALVFVDVGVVEASLGCGVTGLGRVLKTVATTDGVETLEEAATGVTRGYLSTAMRFKYPFSLGLWTLYPTFGCGVDVNVWAVDATGTDILHSVPAEARALQDFFWVNAGAGLDIPFSYRGFVRTELTFGYGLFNPAERELWLNVTHAGWNALLLTLEPELSVCVGWKL